MSFPITDFMILTDPTSAKQRNSLVCNLNRGATLCGATLGISICHMLKLHIPSIRRGATFRPMVLVAFTGSHHLCRALIITMKLN